VVVVVGQLPWTMLREEVDHRPKMDLYCPRYGIAGEGVVWYQYWRDTKVVRRMVGYCQSPVVVDDDAGWDALVFCYHPPVADATLLVAIAVTVDYPQQSQYPSTTWEVPQAVAARTTTAPAVVAKENRTTTTTRVVVLHHHYYHPHLDYLPFLH